jgi:glycerol-3-phosphate cytidylyltransferase
LDVDIFVIGEDWGNKPHNIAVESFLKSRGKQIVQVSYNPQTSSTKIKQRVMAQNYAHLDIKKIRPHIPQANVNIKQQATSYFP